MKSLMLLWLIYSLLLSGMVHAEGMCPAGMFSTNPPGVQGPISCAPIPNYAQNHGQAPQQTQQPQPLPERWQDHWGAIATDPVKGILGTSVNMLSQSQAQQTAFDDCRAKGGTACKQDISYLNQCAALVAGESGYNTKAGLTIDMAVQSAMKFCNAKDHCYALYTACSLPVRIQ